MSVVACVREREEGHAKRGAGGLIVRRSEERRMVEQRLNLGRDGDSNSSSVAGNSSSGLSDSRLGPGSATPHTKSGAAKRGQLLTQPITCVAA